MMNKIIASKNLLSFKGFKTRYAFKSFPTSSHQILTLLLLSLVLVGGLSQVFRMRSPEDSPVREIQGIKQSDFPNTTDKIISDPSLELPKELPFSGFIENKGQVDDSSILYYYSTSSMSIGFGISRITFVSTAQNETSPICFSLTFPEATPVTPEGKGKKSHPTNFYYGNLHLMNVPSWEEIWYYDLYPQIDLRYYMTTEGLKYDFIVQPGGNPAHITVKVNGEITLEVQSQKVIITALNPTQTVAFQDSQLRVFQADKIPVSARFVSKHHSTQSYGFALSEYDSNQPLIIDPRWISFSTYLGGGSDDSGVDIAVDSEGNSYIVGWTQSTDFPTENAYNDTYGGNSDVYVTKLNATGNGLLWSTYLGGSQFDQPQAITIDTSGNCYITGETESYDFPTLNAYDYSKNSALDTYPDVFVSKLDVTGGLVYSTYLGGNDYSQRGMDIAVDIDGNCSVIGATKSNDFPTYNAIDDSFGGGFGYDAFVTKLNATGNGLVFSTYLGGPDTDYGEGIAVDTAGNVYVIGVTAFSAFPVQNAFDDTLNGSNDAFVTKMNNVGNLVYSTYLGGSSFESGESIAVDTAGNAYITGITGSSDFPTQNAFDDSLDESLGRDAFVTKLNATGNGLNFSTYLGGSFSEQYLDIAIDSAGNSYVTGQTGSTDFPMYDAYQSNKQGSTDAFVTHLNATGNGLVFSTYLGGSNLYGPPYNGLDSVGGIAVDNAGNIYVTGTTETYDFPLRNAFQSTRKGNWDAFVTKFGATSDDTLPTISSIDQSPLTNVTYHDNITITANGVDDDLSGIKAVTLYYSLNGGGWGTVPMNGIPYQATIGPFPSETILRYYVQASDWATNTAVLPVGAPGNYTEVEIGSNSPVLSPKPIALNATEEILFQYDFNATFHLSENFTWTLTGNTTWLVINSTSGMISGLPNRSHLGVWNVTILVEADVGETTIFTTFLIVNIMDIAPEFTTMPSSLNTTEITDFYYDFNASIAFPSNLTWTLSGNATTWLGINTTTGIIMGTANYSHIGIWNVTVTVMAEVGYPTNYTTFLTVTELSLQFVEVTLSHPYLLYDIIPLQVRVETNTSLAIGGIEVEWWLDNTLLNTIATNSTGYSTWLLQLTSSGTHHVEAKVPVRGLQADIYLPTTALEFWFNGLINETPSVWLALGDNYTIHGQLVDDAGTPVSGVDLAYALNDISLSSLETDSHGWLNTTQLFLTAGTYTVTILKDGIELSGANDTVAELLIYVVTSSPMVTVISPSTTTTETVIGQAVAFVGWIYFNETPPIAVTGTRVGLLVNGTQVDSQFSDTNGYLYFNYAFVTSGTFRVAFYYNEQNWGEIWVTVTAGYYASWTGPSTVNGTVGQALEFTIYVLSNTSTFHRSITLTLNDGTPVIGAQVDWYINDAYQNSTYTGSDGRASFSYIFATLGFYKILAKHEGVILATFDVNIAEAPKKGLEKFVEENASLIIILIALLFLFVVIGAVSPARRQVTRSISQIKTVIGRKTVFGPRYCARTLTKELEEKFGQDDLREAALDPAKQEAIQREVSAKLTRFPEFMTKAVDEKVEFTQKTTELIIKRYIK